MIEIVLSEIPGSDDELAMNHARRTVLLRDDAGWFSLARQYRFRGEWRSYMAGEEEILCIDLTADTARALKAALNRIEDL
jgi:hypothetical protein